MNLTPRTIYIGSDHAGYPLKEELKKHMTEKGVKFLDLGSFSMEAVDYPDIAREVCEKVVDEPNSFGVLVCGTGLGMAMTANKRKGIRAADCVYELMAKLARAHNDANVLCLGGRLIGNDLAKNILDTFLNTPFEALDRYKRRISKMDEDMEIAKKKKENEDRC